MGLGDALDDCQAKPHTRVVGADALGAALKGLDERGDELRGFALSMRERDKTLQALVDCPEGLSELRAPGRAAGWPPSPW